MKIYLVENAGGPTPYYSWLTAEEIISRIRQVNKAGRYKPKNEKTWQRAMKTYLKGWSILESDICQEE